MFALILAAATQAAAMPAGVVTPPRIIAGGITDADCPAAALRYGVEGRTQSRITLDAAGKVTSCIPAATSGHRELDVRACQLAVARMRFSPALDATGHGIAIIVILPVQWAIR